MIAEKDLPFPCRVVANIDVSGMASGCQQIMSNNSLRK